MDWEIHMPYSTHGEYGHKERSGRQDDHRIIKGLYNFQAHRKINSPIRFQENKRQNWN